MSLIRSLALLCPSPEINISYQVWISLILQKKKLWYYDLKRKGTYSIFHFMGDQINIFWEADVKRIWLLHVEWTYMFCAEFKTSAVNIGPCSISSYSIQIINTQGGQIWVQWKIFQRFGCMVNMKEHIRNKNVNKTIETARLEALRILLFR